jgi:hypothetical protein
MNSTFKTILILVAVVATVFGLTVIAQYTLKPAVKPSDVPGNADDAVGEIVRYDLRQMRFDPESPYPEQRRFPGYFEVGETISAVFWVNNPNPYPVRVATRGRSCTSCTEAGMAVLDSPALMATAVGSAAAILGGVALAYPDRFESEAWSHAANTLPGDRWQAFNFDQPSIMLTIPPADPETGPTWAAIRVKVVVKPGPHVDPRGISADLAFHSDALKFPQQTKFVVEYIGVPPFDIQPKELKFGEFAPSNERKSQEIVYYSSTQEQLPPPVAAADGKDPFLAFGTPVRLDGPELQQLIASQGGAKAGVKILAAYRVPVILNRTVAMRELDIGPLDKSFTVTASSGTGASHSVQGLVKATVQGVVSLDGGAGFVDLGDFNGRSGTRKEATLVSEQGDLELEPFAGEHRPESLQVRLGEPRNEGSRRLWTMTLSIDPNLGLGNLPPGSAAVFKVRSTGQILRIPVKGHGKLTSR